MMPQYSNVYSFFFLLKRYGQVSFTLPNLVNRVLSKLNTEFDLENINLFLKKHSNLGLTKPTFSEMIEVVKTNLRWRDMNLQAVKAWLNENLNGNLPFFH